MVHIATDEARAQLAELVLRASRGETILITESGRPMAKLIPAGESQQGDMSLEQVLVTLHDIRSRTQLEPGHALKELIDEGRKY